MSYAEDECFYWDDELEEALVARRNRVKLLRSGVWVTAVLSLCLMTDAHLHACINRFDGEILRLLSVEASSRSSYTAYIKMKSEMAL